MRAKNERPLTLHFAFVFANAAKSRFRPFCPMIRALMWGRQFATPPSFHLTYPSRLSSKIPIAADSKQAMVSSVAPSGVVRQRRP